MYKVLKTKLKTNRRDEEFIDGLIKTRNDMWNTLVAEFNPKYKDRMYPKDTEVYNFLRKKFPQARMFLLDSVRKSYKRAWQQTFSIKARREPTFHSWRLCNSFSIETGFSSVKNNRYHLSKNHHIELAEPVSDLKRKDFALINISRRSGKYYISLTWKVEDQPVEKSEPNQIGLDWGCENFFTDNNGKTYNLPKRLFRQTQRIRALQRVVSRKDREGQSKNWQKAQKKLSDAWCRYNNLKTDYIEKLTYNLLKQNELIAIEDLNIQWMVKSSHKLRRKAIYKNCYSRVRNRLLTKKSRFSSEVVLVDRTFPSSQLDPFSGAKHPEMKNLKNKHFKCDNGLVLHRDQVAAMNILNEGKRIANLHVLSE